MNIPLIFQFLKDIAANNDRKWFQAHRSYYEQADHEFENMLTAIIARISDFDDSIRNVTPRDCMYRIYRDIRFSEDKTPYKLHFGGYINAKGKKSNHCGYYVHLQPGNSLLAGGSYCPPPPILKALRQAVYDNMDEFRSIVEDPAFKRYFPVIGENFLKSAPKGFSRDYPYLKYVQCKEYTVSHAVPDTFFQSEDFLDRTADIFRQMKRFADFINYTIDDFE